MVQKVKFECVYGIIRCYVECLNNGLLQIDNLCLDL